MTAAPPPPRRRAGSMAAGDRWERRELGAWNEAVEGLKYVIKDWLVRACGDVACRHEARRAARSRSPVVGGATAPLSWVGMGVWAGHVSACSIVSLSSWKGC